MIDPTDMKVGECYEFTHGSEGGERRDLGVLVSSDGDSFEFNLENGDELEVGSDIRDIEPCPFEA